MSTIQRIQEGPCGKYAAEAIFFLFKIGEAMLDPSVRLYIYQSVCQQEYHENQSTCLELQQDEEKEDHIQAMSANYIMAYKILLNCPVIILGLFCGAWSDHIGRKLPVVFACTGAIFAVLLFMATMLEGVPVLPLVLTGSALRGMFGKSAVVTMALHSYISDISSKEERTKRLGMLLGMNFMGYFVGSLLTGVMLDFSSFNLVFCAVIVIYAICVMIALACMRESLHEPAIEDAQPKIRNPFHVKHVQASLSVILRPRADHDRLYIWFCFICLFSQQLTKSGEIDIALLFTKRSPLSWSKGLYGYLLAADYAALAFSVLFLLPLLVYFIKPHDLFLISLGTAFKSIRLLIMAFATETWLVFFSVFIGCPSGMIVSSAKSLVSKLVSEDEIGKCFSLISCLESVSNLIGTVIFTNLYTATASKLFPGFTFAMDSLFYVIFVGCVLITWQDMRRSSKYYLLEGANATKTYGSTHNGTIKEHKEEEGTENPGFTMDNETMSLYDAKTTDYDVFKANSELLPVLEEREAPVDGSGKDTLSMEN